MPAVSASRGRGRPPLDLDESAVLRAALAAFAELGPHGTSMERVAERCGVAKTTLHDRFGTKSQLYDAALAHEQGRLAQHLVDAYSAGERLDAAAQIRNGYVALLDYARENEAAFRVLFGGVPGTNGAIPEGGRNVVVAAVTRLVSGYSARFGIELGRSAEVIADVIVGAGEYAARRLAVDRELDADAVIDLITDVVTGGVLAAVPGPAITFDARAAARGRAH